MDQRDMGEFGDRPIERTVDLGLAERIAEMLATADHMGDLHVMVVDDDREVVGRGAVRAQDDQIVEFLVVDADLAEHQVAYRRRALLRGLEADHRGDPRHRQFLGLGWIALAPRAVDAHRALFGARLFSHRLEFGRRAIAVIGAAGGKQLASDFGMPRGVRGLMHDLAVPGEAQPLEPIDDRGDRLFGRAQAIGVLDAQPEDPTIAMALVVAREEPVEQRRAGAPDMEEAGRRGSKADDDAHGRYVSAAPRLRHPRFIPRPNPPPLAPSLTLPRLREGRVGAQGGEPGTAAVPAASAGETPVSGETERVVLA